MCVLTGETGAGKSIVLDAIDIVLGGRINQRLIRNKTQNVFIKATFQVNSEVLKLLQTHKINYPKNKQVIFSREISFICGHRLQGLTKLTFGVSTDTLSLIEHSVTIKTLFG